MQTPAPFGNEGGYSIVMSTFLRGSSFAQRERTALVDLCAQLGPAAPTLDEGWLTRDLLTHLRIRESYPRPALGIFLSVFRQHTLDAEKKLSTWPYSKLLDSVLLGPPWWSPLRLLDTMANTVEMFVHHEDVIRANDVGDTPRELTAADRHTLWTHAIPLLKAILRRSTLSLVLKPIDGPSPIDAGSARGDVVVISGPTSELVLWTYGRSAASVTFNGDSDAVAAVQELDRHV